MNYVNVILYYYVIVSVYKYNTITTTVYTNYEKLMQG